MESAVTKTKLVIKLLRAKVPRPVAMTVGFLTIMSILPFVIHSQFYIHILIMVFFMGYLTTAWGLVGQTGQLSLGHAGFLGVGAYTSTILYQQFGVSPWIGMWAGAGLAMVCGFIVGLPSLRLRGIYFALATLAFAYIMQIFVLNTIRLGPIELGGAPGLHILLVNGGNAPAVFQFASKTPYYFIALGMLTGVVSLNFIINRSRIGYYWLAIRSDQDAAEALGVNATRYRLWTFTMSSFLTGLAGTFYAQYFLAVDPRRVLDVGLSLEIVLAGIVGGWQTVFGPMIGAFIMTPMGHLMRAQLGSGYPGLHLLVYGIALMLFIQFLPKGLAPELAKHLSSVGYGTQRREAKGSQIP